MDALRVFINARNVLQQVGRQAERFSPKFRDGTAGADWLERGINKSLNDWQMQLAMWWHLSSPTKTLALSDFALQTPGETPAIIEARLRLFQILPRDGIDAAADLATFTSKVQERDRTKMIAFFRADMGTPGLNVSSQLNAVKLAMDAARDAALAVIPTTGDQNSRVWEEIGGERVNRPKTITEMGWNTAPVADELDALAQAVRALVRMD